MAKTFTFIDHTSVINLDNVGKVHFRKAYIDSVYIEKFPVTNFFRCIFRLPLKKPQRQALLFGGFCRARVVVIICGKEEVFYFKSNAEAKREMERMVKEIQS